MNERIKIYTASKDNAVVCASTNVKDLFTRLVEGEKVAFTYMQVYRRFEKSDNFEFEGYRFQKFPPSQKAVSDESVATQAI